MHTFHILNNNLRYLWSVKIAKILKCAQISRKHLHLMIVFCSTTTPLPWKQCIVLLYSILPCRRLSSDCRHVRHKPTIKPRSGGVLTLTIDYMIRSYQFNHLHMTGVHARHPCPPHNPFLCHASPKQDNTFNLRKRDGVSRGGR